MDETRGLRYVGVDPESGKGNSPTVWVNTDDPENVEVVLQGWDPDDRLRARLAQAQAPGHAPGIPAGESVIRVPARMTDIIRKACDEADRAAGLG